MTTINKKVNAALKEIEHKIEAVLNLEESSVSSHDCVTAPLQDALHNIKIALLEAKDCEYHEDDPRCLECSLKVPHWNFKQGMPYCVDHYKK